MRCFVGRSVQRTLRRVLVGGTNDWRQSARFGNLGALARLLMQCGCIASGDNGLSSTGTLSGQID